MRRIPRWMGRRGRRERCWVFVRGARQSEPWREGPCQEQEKKRPVVCLEGEKREIESIGLHPQREHEHGWGDWSRKESDRRLETHCGPFVVAAGPILFCSVAFCSVSLPLFVVGVCWKQTYGVFPFVREAKASESPGWWWGAPRARLYVLVVSVFWRCLCRLVLGVVRFGVLLERVLGLKDELEGMLSFVWPRKARSKPLS